MPPLDAAGGPWIATEPPSAAPANTAASPWIATEPPPPSAPAQGAAGAWIATEPPPTSALTSTPAPTTTPPPFDLAAFDPDTPQPIPGQGTAPVPAQTMGTSPGQDTGQAAPEGILPSLVSGFTSALSEGKRLFSGGAFDDTQAPAPMPRTAGGDIAAGLGHQVPTLAAMTLGAAAGAPFGGPVGAAAGGAIAGGTTAFAQALVPAYDQARQQGLSHDDAVNRAYEVAASSGVLTGVTAPIFGLAPFKSAVSNILLHALGTGPAVGLVQRGAVTPMITGQTPSLGELGEGALSDIVTGGLTAGGMHLAGMIPRLLPEGLKISPTGDPSPEGGAAPGQPLLPAPDRGSSRTDLVPPVEPPGGSSGLAISGATEPPPVGAGAVTGEPPLPVLVRTLLSQAAQPPTTTTTSQTPATTGGDDTDVIAQGNQPDPGQQQVVTGAAPAAVPGTDVATTGQGADGTVVPVPGAPPAVTAPNAGTDQTTTAVVPVPGTDVATGGAPAPVAGAPAEQPVQTVTTSANRRVDTRPEVVEASTLTPASGDLQPRDRTDRVAAQAQQNDIYSNFDPERLHQSPEADRGSPIVGPDNIVETGNNRVAVIKRVHEEGGPKSDAYRAMIQRQTGVDTTGMTAPVLIRRRLTEMTPAERVAFAREANVASTQRMSATEQAKIDASALTNEHLATLEPGKELTSVANQDFVRKWVSTLPQTEHNAVLDANGRLSAEGLRRLNGAILAKAYDDTGTLARGLESTDDTVKGISGALADAAPAVAGLRAAIEAGRVPAQFDITKDITQAVDAVRSAREKGVGRDGILNQQDAFNPLSPTTQALVKGMFNVAGTRPASRQAIAQLLRDYATEAQKQSTSAGLFGEQGKITPDKILDTFLAKRQDNQAPQQGNLLGKAAERAAAREARAQGHTHRMTELSARLAKLRAAEDRLADSGSDKGVQDHAKIAAERQRVEKILQRLQQTYEEQEAQHADDDAEAEHEEQLAQDAADAEDNAETEDNTDIEDQGEAGFADAGGTRFGRTKAQRKAGPHPIQLPGQRQPHVGRVEGQPKTFDDYAYSNGASVYHGLIVDAGLDPDLVRSFPIARQNQIFARQIQNRFGFSSVTVEKRADEFSASNQMLDFYRAATDMSNALQIPYTAISLNGRLKLVMEKRTRRGHIGVYYPGQLAIGLAGQSNSFAHEWTHALDHYLSDMLISDPNKRTLLSMNTRDAQLDITNGVMEHFAKLINTMYYNEGELAVRRLQLETTASKVHKTTGAPTVAALEALQAIRPARQGCVASCTSWCRTTARTPCGSPTPTISRPSTKCWRARRKPTLPTA